MHELPPQHQERVQGLATGLRGHAHGVQHVLGELDLRRVTGSHVRQGSVRQRQRNQNETESKKKARAGIVFQEAELERAWWSCKKEAGKEEQSKKPSVKSTCRMSLAALLYASRCAGVMTRSSGQST